MGGPFVITNAGISSSGTYPCSTQKDAAGYYICDGTSLRVYMYQANGSWVPVSLTHSLGGNDNDVPSMGDPIASITPTIVDSRLEAGNSSDYLVWQYFSRMYHVFGQ